MVRMSPCRNIAARAENWGLNKTEVNVHAAWLESLAFVDQSSRRAAIRPADGASTNKEVIPLILTYNPTNSHVKNILTKYFELHLQISSRVLGAYRRDSNLRLLGPQLSSVQYEYGGGDSNGTFPCRRPRCKSCAYTNSPAQVNTPGGPLTIRQKFVCTTSDLIYIITSCTCTLCYIGETGRRLGNRFSEHLRSVEKKANLPVAKHFSSPGRTTEGMMVSVVRTGFRDTAQRRSAEGRLIFKCQTLQTRGINIDFSFI